MPGVLTPFGVPVLPMRSALVGVYGSSLLHVGRCPGEACLCALCHMVVGHEQADVCMFLH
jgi:hypothetical protein